MTIAVPTPRQHSSLAERPWPHWIDSDPIVEADGHVENTQIRRPLPTEADPIDVSTAHEAITFGPFRLFPTHVSCWKGKKLFTSVVAPLISSSHLLNVRASSSPRMS